MNYEKIAKIIDSLINNTLGNNVNWKISNLHSDAFEIPFQNATLVIYKDREKGCDFVYLVIYNKKGNIIDPVSGKDLVPYFEKPYEILDSLYKAACLQASGVEETLNHILYELPAVSEKNSLLKKN